MNSTELEATKLKYILAINLLSACVQIEISIKLETTANQKENDSR